MHIIVDPSMMQKLRYTMTWQRHPVMSKCQIFLLLIFLLIILPRALLIWLLKFKRRIGYTSQRIL